MKRAIKFRAWDAHNKEMIDPYCELREHNHFWGEDMTNTHHVSPVAVMQYTGLKDKHSKEIYEGDVLFVDDNYARFGWAAAMRGEVIFDKGKFMLTDNSGARFFFEDNEIDYMEVIGNIYENPNLLKP